MAWNALAENRRGFYRTMEVEVTEQFIEYTSGLETLIELNTDFMLKMLNYMKVFENGTLLVMFLNECGN